MERGGTGLSDLPAHTRVASWNRVLAESIFDGHLELVGTNPPHLDVRVTQIGNASCIDASTSPILYYHGKDAVRTAARRVFLQAPLSGSATYFEDGVGHHITKPGGLTLGESGQSGGFVCDEPVRVVGISLPYEAIVPRFIDPEDFRRNLSDSLAVQLLIDLLAGLARGELGFARENTLLDAIGGLLGLAVQDGREDALTREKLNVSRFAALRDHLRTDYTDSALSPATVAARFRISLRHLHRLFEQSGRSFGEELLSVRLQAVAAALRDPAQSHRTIANLAFSAGFNDLSHFNRQFRARYDAAPREVRRSIAG